MNIPVVLPTVHVDVTTDGLLHVDVDGSPYAAERHLSRRNLRSLISEITATLASPVRVDVREADGTTFSDIEIPTELPAPAPAPEGRRSAKPTPALAGAGFQPGEEVALAYVVSRQTADSSGAAAINLPPALLAATHGGLVLLGLASQTVTPIEVPA